MGRLIYSAMGSLDGYLADEQGTFQWAAPDEEVFAFLNDAERAVGTHLYGRRMYEVMVYWETAPTGADQPPVLRDWATIWQGLDKVVYSRTLDKVSTTRTRLEREFDPAAVAELKASSARDLSIGGAALAAHAIRAGLVDELQLYLAPIIVGGGTRLLPDHARLGLRLEDERRFNGGTVYLRYGVA